MRSKLPSFLRDALDGEPDGDALAEVWQQLGDAPLDGSDESQTDAAWAALRRRIRRMPEDRPVARPRRARWAVGALTVTALAAIVFLTLPVTHQAPPGMTEAVQLADGSVVTLNSGSELRHARIWLGDRSVVLDGEAYFDVEPGDDRFVVETHNAQVIVLGTAFNVRAWPSEAGTAVAVTEGHVRVEAADDSAALSAGESAIATGREVSETSVDAEQQASWRMGAISFTDRPLADVLAEVERRYDVTIRPLPSAPLDVRVSAHYVERPDLDELLSDLGAATGARFEGEGEGYRVRSGSSRRITPPTPVQP